MSDSNNNSVSSDFFGLDFDTVCGNLPADGAFFSRNALLRAALVWFDSQNPASLSTCVPVAGSRFRADAAAAWTVPGKHHLLQLTKTAVAEIRFRRNECWPECSDSSGILSGYRKSQRERFRLEEEIRRTEPQLKDTATLFPEYEVWNYDRSANPNYRACLEKLREYESALYRGSRFEKIRAAEAANELWLVVPDGLVAPDELAEGWGLLYVSPKCRIRVARRAEFLPCSPDRMMNLSQSIAASAARDVLFSHGIVRGDDGSFSLRKAPRRRNSVEVEKIEIEQHIG